MSRSRRNKRHRMLPPIPQTRDLGLTRRTWTGDNMRWCGTRKDRWAWNDDSTIFLLRQPGHWHLIFFGHGSVSHSDELRKWKQVVAKVAAWRLQHG